MWNRSIVTHSHTHTHTHTHIDTHTHTARKVQMKAKMKKNDCVDQWKLVLLYSAWQAIVTRFQVNARSRKEIIFIAFCLSKFEGSIFNRPSYTSQKRFLFFLSLLLFIHYTSFSLFCVCFFFYVIVYRYTKITVIFLRKMFSALNICHVIREWCKTQQTNIVNLISKSGFILTEFFFSFFFFYCFYLLSSVPLSIPSFSRFFHIRNFILISLLLSSLSLILVLSIVPSFIFNNNNNNNNYYYYYIYLLQFGCYPVAVVILHVYKTWNWLLLNLSREGYMRSM